MRNTSDIDETVHLLSVHFKVPKEKVLSSYPYRGYGIYLSRKHTPCSNAEIGRYFGGLTYSGVTKIGTRLRKRMRGDEEPGGEPVPCQGLTPLVLFFR